MKKNLRKLHQWPFCLLILFLPTQLGRHFWLDWAMVKGVRIDYLSPTIYLTDLLVLLVLVFFAAERTVENKAFIKKLSVVTLRGAIASSKVTINWGLGILPFLFIFGILRSANPLAGFYKLLKLIELFLLGIYVKKNLTTQKPNKITAILSITVIYSSLIAWAQFLRQSSIGSLLWWLGERTFTLSTPGIAQVALNGRLFLRPYATFPHPNVLGGYLAVVLPLIMQKSKIKKLASQVPFGKQNDNSKFKNILKTLAIFLGVVTFFITFSRAVWVVGGLGMVAAILLPCFKTLKKRKKGLKGKNCLVFACLLVCLFAVFLFLGKERLLNLKAGAESVWLRKELNGVALLMIKKHPLTGVGLNNFIPSLPQFKKGLSYKELQPAHNVYLLIAAESGLVGLGIFLWLIYLSYRKLLNGYIVKLLKKKDKSKITIWQDSNIAIGLTTILLLGLFDHYFYTLQQTQLLFALVLGMVFGLE